MTDESHSPSMPNWNDDPLWYRDAIIYEVHVKAFFDGNDNGFGDFRGLTEKLDYLQDLGINTLWLLPFYPSPFKDDGYDIADYRGVHADYGSLADVRQFIREAHQRGLKIITELIINHTSDQHPWFQAARRAPAGSSKRNFYVWSDTDKKFPETRIIFTDSEKSNWAWDEVARAYYWHRFFSHQPDLNFDNPAVVKAVIRIMRFWLDMGVDGLRLDAIPYLCVREGTNNENLPETHAVIKQIRAVIDTHYQNRMLLAEANQWPEDVCKYFGDGDECHMAYHFPLMPRIYMAVAQEDRHPIVEIMHQTPDIPENCQWAIFLRNHDELTLEMVTSRERDYMYQMYAADPRMRVNVGIRRRLASLMDNNRDKIELMNFLLMTMPGSPIIYYGDELGMGDNIFLGDRNGVRTPMQWSPDRNGGFSSADPQRLYLPPIMDPIYGYQAVNVEAQSRNLSSLLHWTKRLIAVRKKYHAFGRGRLQFLKSANRKILAYVRIWQDEIILCVVNLARTAQPVELDLAVWKERVPVELLGGTSFPPIEALPYQLTLKGYGYFSFRLASDVEIPYWHEVRMIRSELPVLVLTEAWIALPGVHADASLVQRIISTATASQLTHSVIGPYLASKHWFKEKNRTIEGLSIVEKGEWNTQEGSWLLTLIEVCYTDLEPERYFLPLAIRWEDDVTEEQLMTLSTWTLAKVRHKARMGMLYGAFGDERFCRALARGISTGLVLEFGKLRIEFQAYQSFAALADGIDTDVSHPALEQSNTAVYFDNRLFLKCYRRLQPGINPEVEVGRYLTESAGFLHAVPVAGSIEIRDATDVPYTLALLQPYVEHQSNGWSFALDYVARFLADQLADSDVNATSGADSPHGYFLALMEIVGRRTGELHLAFSQETGDPAFTPEPIVPEDIVSWSQATHLSAVSALDALEVFREAVPEEIRIGINRLLAQRQLLLEHFSQRSLDHVGGLKTRYHGNYHLGQVLRVQNDFVITDFEGDPECPLTMRRCKHSPLRDVASMLCCFSYVSAMATNRATAERPHDRHRLGPLVQRWEAESTAAFLAGYYAVTEQSWTFTSDMASTVALIEFFTFEKILDELCHEMEQRPDWLSIPLFSLLRRLEGQ
ncbi:maltose alpha-D-glucosyltransferase [Methylomonas lenta]|nr:maltose alpha-D-glucosyltransferase [Methylomonas lenta]